MFQVVLLRLERAVDGKTIRPSGANENAVMSSSIVLIGFSKSCARPSLGTSVAKRHAAHTTSAIPIHRLQVFRFPKEMPAIVMD